MASCGRIRRLLKVRHMTTKRHNQYNERNAKIIKLWNDGNGLTYAQLAERFGITRSDVSGIISKHKKAQNLVHDLEACKNNDGVGTLT
jgi:predicted HTH transcriptional regulator